MAEKAERLEELITERVVGSSFDLAMMYERYPKEAEIRLRRLERAWHIINGTDDDIATTLLLAVEMTAGRAGKNERLDEPVWMTTRLLGVVREYDEDLADELEVHPSKPLDTLVEVVQLRARNADRYSSGEEDDGKTARWMVRFAAVMKELRPDEWPALAGRTVEGRIKKIRGAVGWPPPAKMKVRTRRPRKKPARE